MIETEAEEVRSAVPGRKRDPAIDDAILRAGLELFLEHGIDGASIEQIARRAGVARTTIYRRWSSREALLAQAIELGRAEIGPSAAEIDKLPGSAVPGLLDKVAGATLHPHFRRIFARMIGSVPDSPRLMAIYRETYIVPRKRALVRLMERAQREGFLPPDRDAEIVTDLLAGAVVHRLLTGTFDGSSPAEIHAHLARLLAELGFRLPA